MNSFGIHCDNVNQDELIESSYCTRSLGNCTTIQKLINGPIILVVLPMQSPLTVGMKQVPDHRMSALKALLLMLPSLQTLAEMF